MVLSKVKRIDNSREAVFVAEQNHEVCGYVHIEKYDVLYFETFGNVLGFAVKRSSRNMGIGKSLMNRAEDWAKSIDVKYIRLNSGFERKEAHSFYRNLGYNSEKNQIRFMKEI